MNNPIEGNANALRGDPINGPHNTAAKKASGGQNGAKKKKPGGNRDEKDSETDGGLMLTTSEILDFSEGTDSLV
jgi:hypothetical protein